MLFERLPFSDSIRTLVGGPVAVRTRVCHITPSGHFSDLDHHRDSSRDPNLQGGASRYIKLSAAVLLGTCPFSQRTLRHSRATRGAADNLFHGSIGLVHREHRRSGRVYCVYRANLLRSRLRGFEACASQVTRW